MVFVDAVSIGDIHDGVCISCGYEIALVWVSPHIHLWSWCDLPYRLLAHGIKGCDGCLGLFLCFPFCVVLSVSDMMAIHILEPNLLS